MVVVCLGKPVVLPSPVYVLVPGARCLEPCRRLRVCRCSSGRCVLDPSGLPEGSVVRSGWGWGRRADVAFYVARGGVLVRAGWRPVKRLGGGWRMCVKRPDGGGWLVCLELTGDGYVCVEGGERWEPPATV